MNLEGLPALVPPATADPPLTPEQQELLRLLLAEEAAWTGDGMPGDPPGPAALPSCVVALQPEGARPPLFSVGVFHFRRLARHLAPDQPMYGLLGLDLDEEGRYMERVEELSAHYVRAVRRVQPEGPYHLVGFCFGGLVAFEMARQFEAAGARVGVVALLTTARPDRDAEGSVERPPGARGARLRAHADRLRTHGARYLRRWAGERWRYERIRLRVGSQRLLLLLYRLARRRHPLWLNGLATSDGDAARAARYRPGPYGGTVTLIGHENGGDERAEALAEGWRPLVGTLHAVDVPGDYHMGSLEEPYARPLALRLQALLDAPC